jgi:hypothetical protein
MKCIQAIKETKYAKVGDVKRLSNEEADEKVATGYWKYVSKSLWKEDKTPELKVEETPVVENTKKENKNK